MVVNPAAGGFRGRRAGADTLGALRARGHEVVDLSGDSLAEADLHARQGVVDGMDALVVVGGDGMVHLGVNVVAGTTLPLGIVAAGTGNDISRDFGLPLHDARAAVQAIEHGLTVGARRVDAVRVGTPDHSAAEWFVGVLSAGVDAAVNARTNEMTWPKGEGRYLRAAVAELARFRPYGYRVTLDDGVWESPGTLVAAANINSIGGGMKIAPNARIDDGLLDVVIAGPLTRLQALRLLPTLYSGGHLGHPAVQVLRSRTILIEPTRYGRTPPAAYADGERLGPLPLYAEVHPGVLGVLC